MIAIPDKLGHLTIIAATTFAHNGSSSCRGLPVARYDAAELLEAFGTALTLATEECEMRVMPSGNEQANTYALTRYIPR
jgi:hypothetical protein